VLRPRSVIAQYDTPAAILAAPADDYVASFIGAGGHLKQLALMRVGDVDLGPVPAATDLPTVAADALLRDVLDTMLGAGSDTVLVTEDGTGAGSPVGALDLAHLMAAIRKDSPS
jgi:osmoprotectant transport system ATP-binding protein